MKPGEIPISDAANICKKRGCAYVVIFGVRADGERFHVTTYGMNKKLCKLAVNRGGGSDSGKQLRANREQFQELLATLKVRK